MANYKAAKQYLRAVKKHLICSKENRARLMQLTSKAVNACLDDERDKPYPALVSAIGEPKAFAESLLAGIPGDEVERTRKKRYFRICAVLVSFAVVMVTAFTALAGFYLKYQEAKRDGFTVDGETLIICPKDMSSEEFLDYTADLNGREWHKHK